MTVALAPGDLDTLRRGLADDLARLERERGVAFAPEPALAPGDVRVDAGAGQVDARVREVLRHVRHELEAPVGETEDAS